MMVVPMKQGVLALLLAAGICQSKAGSGGNNIFNQGPSDAESDAHGEGVRGRGRGRGGSRGRGRNPRRPRDEPPPNKKHNILWLLMDDVSTERFPESGNQALEGLLPGLEEFKADGAVYYEHFYSTSSVCAPAQVALFSGMEPADIGGQYQFSNNQIPGKLVYRTVPPDEVEFAPEKFRSFGYWSTGGGKLDYQVGDVMPTFYNEILGGAFTDINSYMERCWIPAIEQDRPFFAMLNMMDNHQAYSTNTNESPIPITGDTDGLPFNATGYSTANNLLYNTGENGAPQPERTAAQDLLQAEILGYRGAFDENSISHANGGVPGYLPDEIGVRSILSREYDLIRNMDFRVSTIIHRLKELGVYDDTMIVIFGDHGSGTYKAKILLQPQSVRTPMWIKYPKNTRLSNNVKEVNGMLVDDQMTNIVDVYPTTLSVLGVKPERYMTGRALEGTYRTLAAERQFMFAFVGRIGDIQGVKTFAAFTKTMMYQKHALTEDAIAEREAEGVESPEVIADAKLDAKFSSRFQFFPAAPLFDRLSKLQLVNALDPSYSDGYKFVTATDAMPPSDVLYDFTTDPFGTVNLLMDYNYHVGISPDIQKWGNNVANVTLSYGDLDLSRLSGRQRGQFLKLRRKLLNWIRDQQYVSVELDWSEGLFGEENRMAREFWPDGVQPETSPVEVDVSGELSTVTPGTIFRYSVVTPSERGLCESLGVEAKASIPEMSPTNSGFPAASYTSLRNGRVYSGYLYSAASGKPVDFQDFFGSRVGCTLFVSEDATFLEADCPEAPPFCFDSRDSTWDGTTWVGVNPTTGEWLGTPITLYDAAAKNWNFAAFSPYVFGPNRDEVYSGLNADGTVFIPIESADTPYNFGYNPAPKFFATDEDPYAIPGTFDPSEALVSKGWGVVPAGSYFRATATPGLDDKGSFNLRLNNRSFQPSINYNNVFRFDSFQYECLLWDVGTVADLEFTTGNNTLAVFTQGVRKGYLDSPVVEYTAQNDGGSVSITPNI